MKSANEIISEIKRLASEIHKACSENDGFNPFQVATDKWRHENYHSRIIAEMLKPDAKHNEGALLMECFIDYLIEISKLQNKAVSAPLKHFKGGVCNVKVTTENAANIDGMQGRVDVLIEADDKVIIVENKINGAPDQKAQLDRYRRAYAQKKEVVAIVYLKAYSDDLPDTSEEVKQKLLLIKGVGKDSLADGWLSNCVKKAKYGSTKMVLRQYKDLLKKQANGVEQDDKYIEIISLIGELAGKFDGSVSKARACVKEVAPDVEADLDNIPKVLARLVERSCMRAGFKSAAFTDEEGVVYYTLMLTACGRKNEIECALDLNCKNDFNGAALSFFMKRFMSPGDMDSICESMKDFGFEKKKIGRQNKRYWISLGTNQEIYSKPFLLVDRMDKILKNISGRRGELEKCLSKN